jgi:cytochrome c-type biogenesis protein CcmH
MRRAAAPVLLLAIQLLSPLALAGMGPDRLADPRLEARALALQRELRCVVCQGQSLDESNAPLAADLRRLIRTKLENGESDAQIEAYLVARYGDFILMKPPLEPETYLLWFGPLASVSIGIVIAAAAILRARNKARAETPV